MSSDYAQIEARIQETMKHLNKNSDKKIAKIAREFDVFHQRLRFRLVDHFSTSEVREMRERRLSSVQNLALTQFIRKLMDMNLHSRLRNIKRTTEKFLKADNFFAFSLNHS